MANDQMCALQLQSGWIGAVNVCPLRLRVIAGLVKQAPVLFPGFHRVDDHFGTVIPDENN